MLSFRSRLPSFPSGWPTPPSAEPPHSGSGSWATSADTAFSNNLALQDAVGFLPHHVPHPYFSWQRSHAVHHSKVSRATRERAGGHLLRLEEWRSDTSFRPLFRWSLIPTREQVNHMYEGESHVPKETGDGYAHYMRELRFNCGKLVHGLWSMWVVSTGWVLYLMFGASGGPAYGLTNHFWPKGVFKTKLFPKKWHAKVIASGAAVIGVVAALAYWAKCTSFATVAAVCGGPGQS